MGFFRKKRNLDSRVATSKKGSSAVTSRKGPDKTSTVPKVVAFHHAGYPATFANTVILRLMGSSSHEGGVYANTAMTALDIIAGNTFRLDTYLTLERDGEIVHLAPDDILQQPNYWFHVPNPDNPDDKYYEFPVTPSFTMWTMPERELPYNWAYDEDKNLSLTTILEEPVALKRSILRSKNLGKKPRTYDGGCVVSGEHEDQCNQAFIVPAEHKLWFNQERMMSYTAYGGRYEDKIGVDTAVNRITLRPDLHVSFFCGDFAIVPQGDDWVAHFFDSTSPLGRMFDNKKVDLGPEVPREFLLARFAFALFPLVRNFVKQGYSRVDRRNPF